MLKAIGAVLVICGTSAWGISGVIKLRRRCGILAELIGAIGTIRGEITTRLTPVPELISHLARETGGAVGLFFKNVEAKLGALGEQTLYDIWSTALENTPELLLQGDELNALREVPRALGRYELEEQRLALLRVETLFEQFRLRAAEKRTSDAKVKGVAGFCAGVFIVLLLI